MRALKATVWTVFLLMVLAPSARASSERNGLTFTNRSGELALVKLVGPSKRVVRVADGQAERVQIAAGTYRIYVRYGDNGHYRYVRGDPFEIEVPANGYVEAELTLHGVVNGNYAVEPSFKEEFNRQ